MAIQNIKIEPDHWANMLWSLAAVDIVRDWELPWLPAARRVELSQYFSRGDIAARLTPQLHDQLRAADQRGSASRLGVYFENLWAFALAHHPDYQLLYRNLPLRADGRTLGELDFVVRHLPSDTTEHWEIAVKFYLQVDAKYWVGPGLRDRLDIKLARMRDHQLPVIRTPATSALLQQQGIHIDRQWTLMPGRLFRPLTAPSPTLGDDINADCAGYWWATADQFLHHFAPRNLRWAVMSKRTWLAPRHGSLPDSQPCAGIAAQLRAENRRGPFCVAGVDGGREQSRGFIVADDWYSAAQAAISST
ncbi:DUF1853 family protein [Microbulbifer hainanensis]|uniref:DUF1853 family protein n=1 Tax=Microbulbifer hainanensis TaxID=2735675 RepID=UPI0018672E58|nr:DUF1853 family protein [Microbulbifer hainanensis]